MDFYFNKVVSEFMILVNNNRTKNIKLEIIKEIIDMIRIYMPGINI